VFAGVALTTRALSEARADLDLTLAQWRVLVVLGETEDGATISQVAARIGAPCRRPVANCAVSSGEGSLRSALMNGTAGRRACD